MFVENKQRNHKIYRFKAQGLSYTKIGLLLGMSKQAVSSVLVRARKKGYIPKTEEKIIETRPYSFALSAIRSKRPNQKLGTIGDLCEFMGTDTITWVMSSLPDDLNFVQYIGVLIKDQRLWFESMAPKKSPKK